MFDGSLSAEGIAKDYFDTAFGEGADEFYGYLKKLENAMKYRFCQRNMSKNKAVSPYYNPEEAKLIATVPDITKEGRELIKKYYNSDYRVRTVSVRLLEHHADFADMLSAALYEKALGNDERCAELGEKMRIEFGKREVELEKYYDHCICFRYLKALIFDSKSNRDAIEI